MASPYPDGSFFAIHKGFKTGVFSSFKEFRCQTEGFHGQVSAVFEDADHASEFVRTGAPPEGVEPLAPQAATPRRLSDGRTGSESSQPAHTRPITAVATRTPAPLPTPSVSPVRPHAAPVATPSQPARNQTRPGQPIPSTPHKRIKPEVEMDQEGDTEPEDDDPALPTLRGLVTPISGARTANTAPVRQTKSAVTPGATAKPAPLGRKLTPGSISSTLKHHFSSRPLPLLIKDEPCPTTGPSIASPTKPATKSQPMVPTLPQLKLGPTPASNARTRECTHCGGTGWVPCSDSEDPPKASGSKRRAESSAHEPVPKRRSDPDRFDAGTMVHAGKGKGKASTPTKPDSAPRTPSMASRERYLIYAVAFVVFIDLVERLVGLCNMLSMLSRLL